MHSFSELWKSAWDQPDDLRDGRWPIGDVGERVAANSARGHHEGSREGSLKRDVGLPHAIAVAVDLQQYRAGVDRKTIIAEADAIEAEDVGGVSLNLGIGIEELGVRR